MVKHAAAAPAFATRPPAAACEARGLLRTRVCSPRFASFSAAPRSPSRSTASPSCSASARTRRSVRVFPGIGPPARHPLQLYSAVGDLLLCLLLPRRARVPGAVARRGCIGFGCLRAALETLRDPATTDVIPGGWLTLPQAAALLLALAAVSLRPREPSIMPPDRRSPAHGR